MTDKILMKKETAGWLIDNTGLTFEQIADFCDMHPLEVQALADRETNEYKSGFSPVLYGIVDKDDIAKCESDPESRLKFNKNLEEFVSANRKVKARYTPMSHRQNRPDAILWLVKNYPELSDAQICRLVHTTKTTIEAIRNRTHRDMANLTPKNPVAFDMCGQIDLQNAVDKANKRAAGGLNDDAEISS